MIKVYTFLTKYRLVILNSVLLFAIICITFLPDTMWLHGTGFWQGVLTVGIMTNIADAIRKAKDQKEED